MKKQPETAAKVQFVKDAEVLKSYLAKCGHDIQISHLLEGLSRISHSRSWHAHSAKLSKMKVSSPAKTQEARPPLSPISLGKQTVGFYAPVAGPDRVVLGAEAFIVMPDVVYTLINQEFLDDLEALRSTAKDDSITVEADVYGKWFGSHDFDISLPIIHVNANRFSISGYVFESNERLHTSWMDIDNFVGDVRETLARGENLLSYAPMEDLEAIFSEFADSKDKHDKD